MFCLFLIQKSNSTQELRKIQMKVNVAYDALAPLHYACDYDECRNMNQATVEGTKPIKSKAKLRGPCRRPIHSQIDKMWREKSTSLIRLLTRRLKLATYSLLIYLEHEDSWYAKLDILCETLPLSDQSLTFSGQFYLTT